jgi:hypothetical protein
MTIFPERVLSKNYLVAGALVVAVVATGYALLSQTDTSVSVWTEIYRQLTCSADDIALLQRLDQFMFAQKMLKGEVRTIQRQISSLVLVRQQGLAFTTEQLQKLKALNKQLLELSCDVDHIFSKLDQIVISADSQSELRSHRKQLIDWFAAEAQTLDCMIQTIANIN